MQYARAILSSVAGPSLQYFSALSHKGTFSKKKKKGVEHKMFVLISSKIFFWNFLILRRIEGDIIKNI